jgi:hypothetical protein
VPAFLPTVAAPLLLVVQVAPDKVLAKRWMRQFAHTWRHFAFFVPWARFMQVSGCKSEWLRQVMRPTSSLSEAPVRHNQFELHFSTGQLWTGS